MRCLPLLLLLVGLAAATSQYGLSGQRFNVQVQGDGQQSNGEALPQIETRRVVPSQSQIRDYLNKLKNNAREIGQKIAGDFDKYHDQLKEAAELIKQQWIQQPTNFNANVKASLNIAKEFGKEVVTEVKQDIKENIPLDKAEFLAKAKETAVKIGEEIKDHLSRYGEAAKVAGKMIAEQWKNNPLDVVNNIRSAMNIAKQFGQDAADKIKADIQEFAE